MQKIFVQGITLNPWILNGVILNEQFACGGEVNSSQNDDHWQKLPLTFAWICKPPYATPPSNESLDNEAQVLMRDVVLKHIGVECGYNVKKTFRHKDTGNGKRN